MQSTKKVLMFLNEGWYINILTDLLEEFIASEIILNSEITGCLLVLQLARSFLV